MATTQLAGEKTNSYNTAGVYHSTISSVIDSHFSEVWTSTDEDCPFLHHKPVEYEGAKPILNPPAMIEEYPYMVTIYGERVIAIKGIDGTINFFGIPR